MNYNVYFSPTGGTKKVADILISRLSGDYQNTDLCSDIDEIRLNERDLCLVSVPSYSGRVPEIAIARLRKIHGNGAKAILVCVYGNRAWEDTLTELQDTLVDCGFICAAAVAAVAEHSIFRQFASGRPDNDDAAVLTVFADKINAKLQGETFGDLHLEGNHGIYKEVSKGGGFKPDANDCCTACGICAEDCPVGAIDKQNPRKTDRDTCIGCMRCVSLCPKHARGFGADFMRTMSEKFAPRLSGRKKNYLFI